MISLLLDESYDLVTINNNIGIQNNAIKEIAQSILNRCSLITGEDIDDNYNGINLDIMTGNSSLEDKKNELSRVISLDSRVQSIENIEYKYDIKNRVGYFTPVIRITLPDGESQTIKFNLTL